MRRGLRRVAALPDGEGRSPSCSKIAATIALAMSGHELMDLFERELVESRRLARAYRRRSAGRGERAGARRLHWRTCRKVRPAGLLAMEVLVLRRHGDRIMRDRVERSVGVGAERNLLRPPLVLPHLLEGFPDFPLGYVERPCLVHRAPPITGAGSSPADSRARTSAAASTRHVPSAALTRFPQPSSPHIHSAIPD
jgi:hypothetical protein